MLECLSVAILDRSTIPLRNDEEHVCARSAQPPRVPAGVRLAGRPYTGRPHVISGGFGSTSLPVALTEAWHQASTPHPCPRFPTAYSLTGVGVASMTVEPTASTSDAAGLISPATR